MDAPQQEALVDHLRQVGLGRYEAAVYVGLLTDSTARVSEISKRTAVPQPKVYQALDSLVEKGFCSIGPDGVNRYRAVNPTLALGDHIEGLRRSEATTRALVEELRVVQEAGQGHQLWAPPIEIVKGARQVAHSLNAEMARCREEILFFTTPPLLIKDELSQTVADARGRGVDVRLLYERSLLDEPGLGEDLARQAASGVQARVIDVLPSKMVLVDRQVAMMATTTSRGNNFMVLVIRHPGLIQHFIASFELHWSKAEKIPA